MVPSKIKSVILTVLLMSLLWLFNTVAVILYKYPGMLEKPEYANEEEVIKYIYEFYHRYHSLNGKYPDSIAVISDYIEMPENIMQNIKVKNINNGIEIYGNFNYISDNDEYIYVKYFSEGLTREKNQCFIEQILLTISIIFLIGIFIKLYLHFKRIKIPVLILILVFLMSSGLIKLKSYIILYLNLQSAYTEHFLMKEHYLQVKKVKGTMNKKYCSFFSKKDFIVQEIGNNILIKSPSPEYYTFFIINPHTGIYHILIPMKLYLFDSYTGSFFKQYGKFQTYKYKNKIYAVILLSSTSNTSNALLIILTIIFIKNIRKKTIKQYP